MCEHAHVSEKKVIGMADYVPICVYYRLRESETLVEKRYTLLAVLGSSVVRKERVWGLGAPHVLDVKNVSAKRRVDYADLTSQVDTDNVEERGGHFVMVKSNQP
ncbi:hypothetical protein NDU88_005778 [Pleurodeles waltl]|uniref:Uncharacterized protein n=1 Tax=Pleurodeles waltl TaxID=8319 RepID=A0AAV7SMR9_PLEWA|nr:hypothetical protein NDU88_005778 [Pleurodeles waltl]